MSQLIVHQVEEKVVRKLKERADYDGISMEQEHRRILRDALLDKTNETPTSEESPHQLPYAAADELFERSHFYI